MSIVHHTRGRRLAALLVSILGVALTGFGASPAAQANGGSYPSQAPVIGSGQTVTGGGTSSYPNGSGAAGSQGTQYYRVNLNFGDRLIVDLTAVGENGVEACLEDPSVTDFTVGQAGCIENAFGYTDQTNRGEWTYTATDAGAYLLPIWSKDDEGGGWGYQMTVRVIPRIAPTIHVRGPKTARVHHYITLHGIISPALHKTLTLKSKSPAHSWQVMGRTKPVNGQFSFRYHLGHKGPHKFQVFFSGGGSHDSAASNVWKVKVH